jgi:glyoxylase-like metal-dependent hydrolase (beta-lactamase superfamily II)
MKAIPVRIALVVSSTVLVATAWCYAPLEPRQDIEVTTHHVKGPIHFLEARGAGNIGVSAGPDGVLMIDDQFADRAPKIQAALTAIQDAPVDFLINTHFHGDHTSGNTVFGQTASILAHKNVRARLLEPDRRTGQPMPAVGLPVVTYPQQVSVHFNGEEIRVEHFPSSHTDGDSVVFFTGSDVVHMGDLFFLARFPYVDIDAGGSVRGLIESVNAVLARVSDETKIIPGHGALANKGDLAEYRDMLVDTLARVEAALAEGASADDLKRDAILADYAEWGTGFINSDRFIDTLVRELSR